MPHDIKPNYRECNGYAAVGPDGEFQPKIDNSKNS